MTNSAPEPVPTVITARLARSFQFNMFADLTDVSFTRVLTNGVTTLTFESELDPTVVQAIRDRMTSRDDADQAARAVLRADCAALVEDDPLRRVYNYLLGEAT